MKNYKFGVTGKDRKPLVAAISQLLNIEAQYLGVKQGYAYQIGDFTLDREGTVTGELGADILTALAEQGFTPEIEPLAETENETPVEETAPEAETDSISITVPMNGFTPESLDNLCRMVLAKEPLIKKALGVDAIPIKVLEDGIEFPWFTADHSDNLMAYAQLITALCATAKEKKRVTAKPQETFENEKFALRVWMIGLGLIGKEYGQIRKLMGENLSGNGAWRYGAPDKAVTEAAPAPETAEKAQTNETPA